MSKEIDKFESSMEFWLYNIIGLVSYDTHIAHALLLFLMALLQMMIKVV